MAFITLIQALCQQSFGLTLPQNCVGPRGPQKGTEPSAVGPGQSNPSGVSAEFAEGSRPADGGGLLVQLGLFVRVEPSKEVKSLTNQADRSQKPERVS